MQLVERLKKRISRINIVACHALTPKISLDLLSEIGTKTLKIPERQTAGHW